MPIPPRANRPHLADLAIELATPRLHLRAFREADVEDLWPWVSDPAFPRQMSWAAHVDRAETRDYILGTHAARAEGSGLVWAIEHDGKAAGCVALEEIVWGRRAWRLDQAELGYWLVPPLWGQGLMTEAVHAVVRFGFETLGLHKVVVGCLADNDGSRRVIEKAGFRYIGRQEEDVYRDGAWFAHLRYELIVSELDDVTSTRRFQRPGTV
jgi:ribosomal-protein-alanine N-acetyltransferase